MMSKEKIKYELLDSGNGRKLERFGPFTLDRPCSQAIWKPLLPKSSWKKADAIFSREEGMGWDMRNRLPESWEIDLEGLTFRLSATNFGHLGVFPEHQTHWSWLEKQIIDCQKRLNREPKVLNLFAYSGAASLAAARAGAAVCHLDASKGMVAWARENAALNQLEEKPIRWITDDVIKFLQREERRGRKYDGIILDPPSFGRGTKGEVFKLEEQLWDLLKMCYAVLEEAPQFFLFSCHTPGFTAQGIKNVLEQLFHSQAGFVESGEALIPAKSNITPLPCGTYSRWSRNG